MRPWINEYSCKTCLKLLYKESFMIDDSGEIMEETREIKTINPWVRTPGIGPQCIQCSEDKWNKNAVRFNKSKGCKLDTKLSPFLPAGALI